MRIVSDEQGITAVLVAVVLVALLGMGAIVVDIGALYQERRELQNGADAGALALAVDCAANTCGPVYDTADSYADANADDGESNIDDVCGLATGLVPCVDPPTIPTGAGYVRVTTSTLDAGSGDTEVKFGLAKVLGHDGAAVRARATAVWGSPTGLTSALPLTISECEWLSYTLGGTVYATPPPYPPWPTVPGETTIYFHDTTQASPCPAGPSGADLPGGFGWLDTSTDCTATSNTTDWFDDKTGRPPPSSCDPSEMAALVGTIVHIPVFDMTNGLNGTNGVYHMSGYAAFYLTGYSINGQYKRASLRTGTYPCSGQISCISGYFTTDSASSPTATIGAVDDHGVVVVKLYE